MQQRENLACLIYLSKRHHSHQDYRHSGCAIGDIENQMGHKRSRAADKWAERAYYALSGAQRRKEVNSVCLQRTNSKTAKK